MSLPEVLGKWMVLYLPDAKHLLGACLARRKHKETKPQKIPIVIETPAGHHVQTIMINKKITVEKLIKQLDSAVHPQLSESQEPQAPWKRILGVLPARISLWRGSRELSITETINNTDNNTLMRVIRPMHNNFKARFTEGPWIGPIVVFRHNFTNGADAVVRHTFTFNGFGITTALPTDDVLVAIFSDSSFLLKIGPLITLKSHFDGIEHVLFPFIETGLPLFALAGVTPVGVIKAIKACKKVVASKSVYITMSLPAMDRLLSHRRRYIIHNKIVYIIENGHMGEGRIWVDGDQGIHENEDEDEDEYS